MTNAFAEGDAPFQKQKGMHPDLDDCLAWMGKRTEEEAISEREKMTRSIERDGRHRLENGSAKAWLSKADAETQRISAEVNGPLWELLLKLTDHEDPVSEMFRKGGPLLEKMPVTGNGVPKKAKQHHSISELRSTAPAGNEAVLGRLRVDAHSAELSKQTQLDATLGRMTELREAEDVDLTTIRVSQRFAVEQGVRPDGSQKIRCVDSCTESGLNPCTEATEHLSPDGLDTLFELMRYMWLYLGVVPHILKVDVDSAFRRIPICPEHRWAAHIAFKHKDIIWIAGHLSMPFGASSSVFAWDRVGAALERIIRVLLKIPVLRYVDDFFTADRPACVKHAMECVVRVIRALLGPSSIAERKVECGLPLEVLGVTIDADEHGAVFWPSEDKVEKWLATLDDTLKRRSLHAGAARKLAGKLSWSAQHVFSRLGRALLRPLYNVGRGCVWSQMIESSLRWWREVLSLQIQQLRPWSLPCGSLRPVQIFCDARGYPPRLAAVIYTDQGRSFYTDMVPPTALMKFFAHRRDNQIGGLELCAIALGLSTFADLCEGRRVRVWSDSCGSEHATKRGSAKAWDHNVIVHAIWVKAAALRCHMVVDRVPTELNISDLPSREEYKLLELMNTRRVEPVLDEVFWTSNAWDTVALDGALRRRD